MIHRTLPEYTEIHPSGWFRIPGTDVEVTAVPVMDSEHTGPDGCPIAARLTYKDAKTVADRYGAKLLEFETFELLLKCEGVCVIEPNTQAHTQRLEGSIKHDSKCWDDLTAAGWDGFSAVLGFGKHHQSGAPEGRAYLKGWWTQFLEHFTPPKGQPGHRFGSGWIQQGTRSGKGPHTDGVFDYGTTTMLERPVCKRPHVDDTDPAPDSGVYEAPPKPVLKKGSEGEDVKEWQRILMADGAKLAPYNDDGDFGKMTHNATVGWQKERGLIGTGVVDATTWAAVGMEPIKRPEPTDGITDWIWATNYTKAERTAVDVIVVHTIEAVEASFTADNTAGWFASGKRAPRASAHYCLDDDSTICCVPESDVAWAAPGCNRTGIQLEHAGYARQTREQWMDTFSMRMLKRSAKLAAAICKRWDIPPVFVDAEGLMRGERGITTHAQVSKGPGKDKTNHYDPGPHFPMDLYIQMIEEEMST